MRRRPTRAQSPALAAAAAEWDVARAVIRDVEKRDPRAADVIAAQVTAAVSAVLAGLGPSQSAEVQSARFWVGRRGLRAPLRAPAQRQPAQKGSKVQGDTPIALSPDAVGEGWTWTR